MSTLGREFELAEHYLALMAIRFGERLRFRLQLDDELRALPVPPLLLMTLVENALQHGVEPHPGVVLIQVTAHIANGDLHVLVHDDGAGVQDKVLGSGVGLRNLDERLHALYGARAGFSLHTRGNGKVEAEFWLPQFPLTPP
jgi:sensor histidine kinase YesM